MQRRKASDFPPEILKLFDGYRHGELSRRDFLDRAARYAVGSFGAVAMFEALQPSDAWADQVARDDPRIAGEYIEYDSPQGSGKVRGYFARPAKLDTHGCIVVVHENRGLTPYIEDVARRLAIEGFGALAPDALSALGGYPGNEEKGGEMFRQLDPKKRAEDFFAAAPYLRSRRECAKLGAVGLCFGGGIANQMAVHVPDLAAVVSFYGTQPAAEEAARIKAPLLVHLAGLDQRVNAGWPAWEAALKANGVRYTMYMYDGVNHAFHNDTTPRYDEAAAKLAWSRTVAFFKENLS